MVGLMPHKEGVPNPNTFRVFLIYCHPNDDFKKKLGLIELGKRLGNDNFVLYRGGNDLEVIAQNFINFFGQWDYDDMKEIDLAYI